MMKRTVALLFIAVSVGCLTAVAADDGLATPAADATVYGMTPRRLWATTAAALALVGVIIGGRALRRSAGPAGMGNGRMGAIVALVAGLIAAVNGGLNLAVAKGGLGTGNGVIGGAAALGLGLIAMALGGMALARSRRAS